MLNNVQMLYNTYTKQINNYNIIIISITVHNG